ncbi:MAG: helix-turn-helix domain-containing protein [Archangiaceae bacterium]|nr:helix-turn-helix domain-containing protein [Archangiaceae bacterium]
MAEPAAALRLLHFHASRGEQIFRTTSLRAPGLVLRHIHYGRLVVDERVLTRVFPYVAPSSHRWAVAMLAGSVEVQQRRPLRAEAGDAFVFGRGGKNGARWQAADFIELEWQTRRPAAPLARALRPIALEEARALAAQIDDRSCDGRAVFERALATFRRAGVPLERALEVPRAVPEADELRLAAALEEQINDLKGRATTAHLAEASGLSARQLQRVLTRFNRRYGINARSWRDVRNRCRVQLAALMLSLPERSVAQIAADVGYASPNAMTRAFAEVKLPAPARFRAMVLGVR